MARKTDSSDEKLDPSLVHKKKARRRLVGAVAFLGAVGLSLPFLLDSEPKPSAQSVQIRVPVREPMTSGGMEPVAPQAKAGVGTGPVVPVVPLEPSIVKEGMGKDFPTPTRVEPVSPEPKSDEAKKADPIKEDAKKDLAQKEQAKKEQAKKDQAKKEQAKKDDSKKDQAKKDSVKKDVAAESKKSDGNASDAKKDVSGKDASKKSEEPKAYRVQIGAYSSEESAMEQLSKATKLGLKAYTEKISGNAGARTRVRVGPFTNREQAEQALAKLKLNGVDAALVAP